MHGELLSLCWFYFVHVDTQRKTWIFTPNFIITAETSRVLDAVCFPFPLKVNTFTARKSVVSYSGGEMSDNNDWRWSRPRTNSAHTSFWHHAPTHGQLPYFSCFLYLFTKLERFHGANATNDLHADNRTFSMHFCFIKTNNSTTSFNVNIFLFPRNRTFVASFYRRNRPFSVILIKQLWLFYRKYVAFVS